MALLRHKDVIAAQGRAKDARMRLRHRDVPRARERVRAVDAERFRMNCSAFLFDIRRPGGAPPMYPEYPEYPDLSLGSTASGDSSRAALRVTSCCWPADIAVRSADEVDTVAFSPCSQPSRVSELRPSG